MRTVSDMSPACKRGFDLVQRDAHHESHRVMGSPQKKMKSVACSVCHARKVKCTGGKPCTNCKQNEQECIYPQRDRQVMVSQSYIDRLLSENERMRAQINSQPFKEELNASQGSQVPTKAQDALENPLFEDRPWFCPVPSLDMPIHIGEASDAGFATRFRQVLSKDNVQHIPRTSYVRDGYIMALSNAEWSWPDPARARYLVEVALSTVCRCYHMVRKSNVYDLLRKMSRARETVRRLEEAKLFTMFALGELYSTKTISKDEEFPGLAFFAHARRMITIPAERPDMELVEIALMLSMYSFGLNRRHSGHIFASSAVRLGVVLGMHLRIPVALFGDRAAREHRVRLWWTAYILDRTWASKLGYPVSILKADIDTELPSEAGLPSDSRDDFTDCEYLLRLIELSRLTGNIIESIYSRRVQQKPFSQRVQEILTDLTSWADSLPTHLQLPQESDLDLPAQHIVYLQLTFNQSVILTTRPVLLYLARRQRLTKGQIEHVNNADVESDLVHTIAKACRRCARHSYSLLNKAWISGGFAVFDYFYAQYLFSAATILAMSFTTGNSKALEDEEHYSIAVSILRQIDKVGNFGAKEFCQHIDAMEKCMGREEVNGPRNGTATPRQSAVITDTGSELQHTLDNPQNMTTRMALADPSLQDFLAQADPQGQLFTNNNMEPMIPFWPDLWVDNWFPQ